MSNNYSKRDSRSDSVTSSQSQNELLHRVLSRTSSITNQQICPVELQKTLDPQIQEELERLNQTTQKINELENELDRTRSEYRVVLSQSSTILESKKKELGSCVEKARPYYLKKYDFRSAQRRAQEVTMKYERAVSCHTAAKEMVAIAEQNMALDNQDAAWHQMLNHATNKVNEATIDKDMIDKELQETTLASMTAKQELMKLEKQYRTSISKSSAYYELKNKFSEQISTLQQTATCIEGQLVDMKVQYKTALQSLEHISERIHDARIKTEKRILPDGCENLQSTTIDEEQHSEEIPEKCPIDIVSLALERRTKTSPDSRKNSFRLSIDGSEGLETFKESDIFAKHCLVDNALDIKKERELDRAMENLEIQERVRRNSQHKRGSNHSVSSKVLPKIEKRSPERKPSLPDGKLETLNVKNLC